MEQVYSNVMLRVVGPLATVGFWLSYGSMPPTRRYGVGVLSFDLFVVAIAIALVVAAARTKIRTPDLILALVIAALLLLGIFSDVYLTYGHGQHQHDFNERLTKIDAVYFAVGTLSTAGTGHIEAISERARTVQLMEMLLGLALVLFAVSAVVARLMSSSATASPSGATPTTNGSASGTTLVQGSSRLKRATLNFLVGVGVAWELVRRRRDR